MPIKNGMVFCINHPDIAMSRSDGFNAITALGVGDNQIQFKADSGIPVQIFYCEVCGYVENYLAPKMSHWDVAGERDPSEWRQFETKVIHAMSAHLELLGLIEIRGSERMRFGAEVLEIDAVGTAADGGRVLFEVKSTPTQRALETGANSLRRAITLFKQYRPEEKVYGALVVPDSHPIESNFNGFPVVKVSLESGQVKLFG